MTSLICGILIFSLGTRRVWDREYNMTGEWEKAARKAGIRFGLTFHHEYSWWWQTAFQSDTKGDKKDAIRRKPDWPMAKVNGGKD